MLGLTHDDSAIITNILRIYYSYQPNTEFSKGQAEI